MKNHNGLSFKNKQSFFKLIDNLPTHDLPAFECKLIDVEGSILDAEGHKMHITLELFKRDPVKIIESIVNDPMLREDLRWEPVKFYADEDCTKRIYNEAWTADDWFNLQVGIIKL